MLQGIRPWIDLHPRLRRIDLRLVLCAAAPRHAASAEGFDRVTGAATAELLPPALQSLAEQNSDSMSGFSDMKCAVSHFISS